MILMKAPNGQQFNVEKSQVQTLQLQGWVIIEEN